MSIYKKGDNTAIVLFSTMAKVYNSRKRIMGGFKVGLCYPGS